MKIEGLQETSQRKLHASYDLSSGRCPNHNVEELKIVTEYFTYKTITKMYIYMEKDLQSYYLSLL